MRDRVRILLLPGVALLLVALGACRGVAPVPVVPLEVVEAQPHRVRFLLTFDDGPSALPMNNPTARILDTLAHNRWQDGIKAIFFVQTRHPRGGGTEIGQQLMRRMYEEGHVLGIHTATPRGHVNHTFMSPDELDHMLDDGIDDIRHVTGDVPRFLRPPFWAHNAMTDARYEAHGLTLLLDDIRIRDGKIKGYHENHGARAKIHADLELAATKIVKGELPMVSDYTPLVLILHDPNSVTARDLELYLGMLIEEARAVGLVVDSPPFVAPARDVMMAAAARGTRPVYTAGARMPNYR
jgi:peptidoglycan/xylan/chitin deacetylase (PgdA/CDA1 family)